MGMKKFEDGFKKVREILGGFFDGGCNEKQE
jgi:hypothetical protein